MPATELASRLNVSQQTLSNWETGLSLIPADKLDRIFDVLGVDANYLYMGREDTLPGYVATDMRTLERRRPN